MGLNINGVSIMKIIPNFLERIQALQEICMKVGHQNVCNSVYSIIFIEMLVPITYTHFLNYFLLKEFAIIFDYFVAQMALVMHPFIWICLQKQLKNQLHLLRLYCHTYILVVRMLNIVIC